jgi:Protein kinase domain
LTGCPACSLEVPEGSRFCPGCGAALPVRAAEPTGPYQPADDAPPRPRPPPAHPAGQPRFVTGQLLAGRYRVVALLGQGGMGEVFRADDLALGQPVALKFLPEHLADDPDRLQRFRKEVALARRVSHPNCCRVYDLAEHDGRPFLTMEFVDGEDLAALLRRVGRLPEEKAVEVARQLCAALAAVHEQGLLHRDLKPANVMLDGRGKVRLADFGLAAAAGDLSASGLRCGTPPYMAPEQLAGSGVTTRSDLFALGLVLYELFTGKKAFAGTDRDTPPSKPRSHVSALDPAVERVLLRCLERDPEGRPASALAVAAALPGGDPLAAALAAGETPSPRMVADAGEEGLISPWLGLTLLGLLAGGLVLIALLNDRVGLLGRVPVTQPAAEMARRARQLLADLGHPDPPADAAGYYLVDYPYLNRVARLDPSPDRWRRLAAGRPPAVYFFYRQAAEPLVTTSTAGALPLVGPEDPPPTRPGMATVLLDGSGRLLELSVVPGNGDTAQGPGAAPDWGPLWRAAGLESEKVKVVEGGAWVPPCAFDRQATLAGQFPDRPDVPLQAEAAAYRGRPVWFRLVADGWVTGEAGNLPAENYPPFFWLCLAPLGVLLAARNIRAGRADWHGASCLTLFLLGVSVLAWLVGGHHAPSVPGEVAQAVALLSKYGFEAALTGLFYLALEPAVRRRWPWGQTAWNRLLAGRLRSPLVGRDVLAGLVLGVGLVLLPLVLGLVAEALRLPPPTPRAPGPPSPHGPLPPLTATLLIPVVGVNGALEVFLLAFLLSLLLRRPWLYWPAFVALWSLVTFAALPQATAGARALMLTWGGLHWAMIAAFVYRFGWLGNMVGASCTTWVAQTPLTAEVNAWYFGWSLLGVAVVLGLAAYGFVTATGGRRLFREGFFGDE